MLTSASKTRNLSTTLENRATYHGKNLAYRYLTFDQQEICLSYTELWQQSELIASALRHGLNPGDRVILAYQPGLDFVIALFACLSADLIVVPLPFPRSGETTHRFIHVFKDCDPRVILTNESNEALLRKALPPEAAALVASNTRCYTDVIRHTNQSRFDSDIKILQYTSGSTGFPKGVMLSNDNLLANLEQIRFAFDHTPDSRGVIWLPHYHDMGLIGGILQPLYVGFPVTLFSPSLFLQRPLRWLEAIDKYQATTSGGPCFAYDLCVEKGLKKTDLNLNLSSWRIAFNGAETVRLSSLTRFANTFERYGFSRRAFLPCYGLAEATLLVTSVAADQGDQVITTKLHTMSDQNQSRTLVSSGTPALGVSVEIRDPNTHQQCQNGELGEICVSGASVSRGYWQKQNPLDKGTDNNQWLKTGDIGFLKGQELYVTGRIKDLIIIRGQNFFAEDIEEIMRHAIPKLEHEGCAAFSVEGIDGDELVLLQELSPRVLRDISIEDITAVVQEAVLRDCGIMPSKYFPIKAGTLIRTSSGKISRSANKKLYAENKLTSLVCPSNPILVKPI